MRDQSYSGRGAGLHEAAADMKFSDISVGQCMFRRCVFLFSEKYVLERFSFRGIFLGGFSETGAVPKYKKTPVRPHFDKSQKGNMFSDCGAMYVT